MAPALRSQCSLKRKGPALSKCFFERSPRMQKGPRGEKDATTQLKPTWKSREKKKKKPYHPDIPVCVWVRSLVVPLSIPQRSYRGGHAHTQTETRECAFRNDLDAPRRRLADGKICGGRLTSGLSRVMVAQPLASCMRVPFCVIFHHWLFPFLLELCSILQ